MSEEGRNHDQHRDDHGKEKGHDHGRPVPRHGSAAMVFGTAIKRKCATLK